MIGSLFKSGRYRKALRMHLHHVPRDLSPHLMRDIGLGHWRQEPPVIIVPRW